MKLNLHIEGMQCEGCVNRIKNVLLNIKGITSYKLSLEDKTLLLEVKKEKTVKEIIEKINHLGFKVIQ